MIEQQLKKAFDPYYQAPIEAWQHFCALCEKVDFKKGEVIKQEGSIAKHGYFLIEGIVGSFIWKTKQFACLDLFFEGSFFADDISLTTNQPSQLELKSIEDCSTLRISKSNIEQLKQTDIGKILFLIGEQHDNIKKERQKMDLMTKTAEERYIELLENKAHIIQRVPQHYIASYLGITKQSLSRIRRKFASKH